MSLIKKKIEVLIFVFFSFVGTSTTIAAEADDENSYKRAIQWTVDNLETINKPLIDNQLKCNDAIEEVAVPRLDATCTGQASKLKDHALKTYEAIIDQKKSLTKAINSGKYNTSILESLQGALGVLNCMEKTFPKTEFFCWKNGQCKVNATAYVEANFFGVRQKQINLCSPFWEYSSKAQIGFLMHELSHICGTGDEAYFQYAPSGSGSPRDAKNKPYYKIADTYNFWYRNGFCIPEMSCL